MDKLLDRKFVTRLHFRYDWVFLISFLAALAMACGGGGSDSPLIITTPTPTPVPGGHTDPCTVTPGDLRGRLRALCRGDLRRPPAAQSRSITERCFLLLPASARCSTACRLPTSVVGTCKEVAHHQTTGCGQPTRLSLKSRRRLQLRPGAQRQAVCCCVRRATNFRSAGVFPARWPAWLTGCNLPSASVRSKREDRSSSVRLASAERLHVVNCRSARRFRKIPRPAALRKAVLSRGCARRRFRSRMLALKNWLRRRRARVPKARIFGLNRLCRCWRNSNSADNTSGQPQRLGPKAA